MASVCHLGRLWTFFRELLDKETCWHHVISEVARAGEQGRGFTVVADFYSSDEGEGYSKKASNLLSIDWKY